MLGDRSHTSPLFAGSLEVLKFCHDAGLKLGILSMDSTANVEIFVKTYQLQDYIQLEMGQNLASNPTPRYSSKPVQPWELSRVEP